MEKRRADATTRRRLEGKTDGRNVIATGPQLVSGTAHPIGHPHGGHAARCRLHDTSMEGSVLAPGNGISSAERHVSAEQAFSAESRADNVSMSSAPAVAA